MHRTATPLTTVPIRFAIAAVLAASAFSGTAAAKEPASTAAAESTAANEAPKCPDPNREGALGTGRPRQAAPVAELPQDVQFDAVGLELNVLRQFGARPRLSRAPGAERALPIGIGTLRCLVRGG